MNKILVFRSSNFIVLDKLLLDIKKKYGEQCDIYIIVQKEIYSSIKEKYNTLNFIISKNGFFSFDNYIKDENLRCSIEKNKYKCIYIPSSNFSMEGCKEIELIASKIESENTYVFTADFKYHKVKQNIFYLKIREVTKNSMNYMKNIFLLGIYNMFLNISIMYSKIK